MTTRQAFEAWDRSGSYSEWRGFDALPKHEQFFLCWQAATAAALERAAEVCDVHAEGWEKNPGANPLAGHISASNCAEAIRALKDADTC